MVYTVWPIMLHGYKPSCPISYLCRWDYAIWIKFYNFILWPFHVLFCLQSDFVVCNRGRPFDFGEMSKTNKDYQSVAYKKYPLSNFRCSEIFYQNFNLLCHMLAALKIFTAWLTIKYLMRQLTWTMNLFILIRI